MSLRTKVLSGMATREEIYLFDAKTATINKIIANKSLNKISHESTCAKMECTVCENTAESQHSIIMAQTICPLCGGIMVLSNTKYNRGN